MSGSLIFVKSGSFIYYLEIGGILVQISERDTPIKYIKGKKLPTMIGGARPNSLKKK